MGNAAVQKLFMLMLTVAVGILFLIRVPRPQDAEIQRLEQQIHAYETALAISQQGPTATQSILPTVAPDTLTQTPQAPLPDDVPPGVSSGAQLPLTGNADIVSSVPGAVPTVILPVPTSLPGMPAVIDAVMTLQVDDAGCAVNPRNVFTNFETMYGVAQFTNMRAGDQITMRFFYSENSSLVYEDTFMVTEPGDFCRYQDMYPDEVGWEVGSYSFAVQVNQDPPRVVNYTVGVLSTGGEPETPTDDQ